MLPQEFDEIEGKAGKSSDDQSFPHEGEWRYEVRIEKVPKRRQLIKRAQVSFFGWEIVYLSWAVDTWIKTSCCEFKQKHIVNC